jgi:hypothetical protein
MIAAVKEKLLSLVKRQEGLALPTVLAMFAIGGLVIVPSISYVTTNLKAGMIAEEEFKGILAADAGVEDALWTLKNDIPTSFPHSYEVADVNGLSVDVNIDQITTIDGEEVGEGGVHADWLVVESSVTYDSGIYSYLMSFTNDEPKNIKIVKILVIFPEGVDYVTDSTSSNVTDPLDANPTSIMGTPSTGITLVWENPDPPIVKNETKYHCFELSGPPGIEGVEGHGFVESVSDDVGTVWISDVIPYSITAQAKREDDSVVATIRAGVWSGSDLEISCWQVIR